MTTEVLICISGNKAVHVINGTNQRIMQPGSYYKFLIHGDVNLSVAETGDFIPWEKQTSLIEDFVKE